MAALNTSELLFEEKTLYQPSLDELKQGKKEVLELFILSAVLFVVK